MKILGKLKYVVLILVVLGGGGFALNKFFPTKQAGVPLELEQGVQLPERPAIVEIVGEKMVQLTPGWKCPGPETSPEFDPVAGIFEPAEWCFGSLSEQDLQAPVAVVREFPLCRAIEVDLPTGRACVQAPVSYTFEQIAVVKPEPEITPEAVVQTTPEATPMPPLQPEVPGESEPFPILPMIGICLLAIGGWKIVQRFIGKPRWVNPRVFPTVDADRASITVDYFVEWKVTNIILYFIARLGGKMEDRLVAFANSACPQIFPNHTFDEQQGMVENLAEQVTQKVLNRARGLGVEVKVHIEGINLSRAAQEQRDIASAEERAGEGDRNYFKGLGIEDPTQISPKLIEAKIRAEAQVQGASAFGEALGRVLATFLGLAGQQRSTRTFEEEEAR